MVFRISVGSLFHNLGAAAVNDLSSKVAKNLPFGRISSMVACERREYSVGCLMVIMSVIYCGEQP